MYWRRRLRKHKEVKQSGRMTAIPQLGPEVYVDDEDDIAKPQPPVGVGSPLLAPPSPIESDSALVAHGFESAGHHQRNRSWASDRSLSPGRHPGVSPQLSPHRRLQASTNSFETANNDGAGSNTSSRRNSGVSAENVLDVLDNSAWGASIRRSFTMRRPEQPDDI